MAPGGWPRFCGNKTRGTQIMTALESLKSTDYWIDGHPDGLASWKTLLQMAVSEGLARQVTSHTYELGTEFWEFAERAIYPESGGGGVEDSRGIRTGGAGGARGFGVRFVEGSGGFGARDAEVGGGMGGMSGIGSEGGRESIDSRGFRGNSGAGGGGGMGGMGDLGDGSVHGGLKGPTKIMTALESLKSTDYWQDGNSDGLAQWKDLLTMAVRDGIARQVTSHTYELGPEFWEAAEKAIHPGGHSKS